MVSANAPNHQASRRRSPPLRQPYIFLFCRAQRPPLLFFFSRRRRHTRSTRDWSSDVCSSDLQSGRLGTPPGCRGAARPEKRVTARSEERREGKSVDLGGRRIIKKKKKNKTKLSQKYNNNSNNNFSTNIMSLFF